ncbi:MAG: LPXTG cell wall anchor domain-containing protein [Lachnospiraceae bacterium]|nr:LPXTG cell wall anchor domain-containing protein [Lachnospiraceae bacterium]
MLNSPKSSLPSTGGIGTKLFYIFGSALMILAAIAFVVKMRFSRK